MDDLDGAVLAIRAATGQAVVGKEAVVEQLLATVLSGGHALVEDVPGVGKTMLAKSLAQALGCVFRRVQFTPDVLPSDITGSSIFDSGRLDFEFRPGPIFTQVLLADEVNRATPRTQSALLEAMEESQVTVDGRSIPLPRPFVVFATQNPVELEGTFPLPEAQIDRFMLRVTVGYPSLEEELAIVERFEGADDPTRVEPVVSPEDVLALQRRRAGVHVSPAVRDYAVALVRSTRTDDRLVLGASPRASLALHRATQARALLRGRAFVLPDDVKAMAEPVLAHRLMLSPTARLRGETAAGLIAEILGKVPAPVEDEAGAPPLGGRRS